MRTDITERRGTRDDVSRSATSTACARWNITEPRGLHETDDGKNESDAMKPKHDRFSGPGCGPPNLRPRKKKSGSSSFASMPRGIDVRDELVIRACDALQSPGALCFSRSSASARPTQMSSCDFLLGSSMSSDGVRVKEDGDSDVRSRMKWVYAAISAHRGSFDIHLSVHQRVGFGVRNRPIDIGYMSSWVYALA